MQKGYTKTKVLDHKWKSLVLEDVPWLIPWASEGKWLWIEFLKHIERTGVLLHLLDMYRMDQVFDDYNRTDIKVNVQSIKHVHTEIISKSFLKGNIVLKTGVRYSSAPILIKAKDSDIQIEIQNQFNVSDSVKPVYLWLI